MRFANNSKSDVLLPGSNYNLLVGVVIFAIGLFKKVVIADNTAFIANPLFDAASRGAAIDMLSGWLAALSFTIQLYFDFSGYSDMAIGLARMFGILLPLNFHSPLRASNIADYWRRWHLSGTSIGSCSTISISRYSLVLTRKAMGMTSSRWPTFIISVVSPAFVTFLIIGVWHGAGWTFVLFGLMHATYICTGEAWREFRRRRQTVEGPTDKSARPDIVGRTLAHVTTLICVLLANVMFRSDQVATANLIYRGMFGLTGSEHVALPEVIRPEALFFVILGCLIVALMPNTQQFMRAYRPAVNWRQWRNVAPHGSPIPAVAAQRNWPVQYWIPCSCGYHCNFDGDEPWASPDSLYFKFSSDASTQRHSYDLLDHECCLAFWSSTFLSIICLRILTIQTPVNPSRPQLYFEYGRSAEGQLSG